MEVWRPADREHWEAEAIRRGWLIPRPDLRYEDVPQRFPRDPGIVTFKDWLDARDWPPKGRKYHEDGSFTDPFPVAGLTFGPDLSE